MRSTVVAQSPRIGNYIVEEALASGGVLETYRVHGANDRRPGVLKLLRIDHMGTHQAEGTKRFAALAARLARTPHAGVARILDVSADPPFIVSESIDGKDLKGIVDQLGVTAGTVGRDWAGQVGYVGVHLARILAAAHKATPPLLHEGLAPGNVIVSPTGAVTITDFGLFASVRRLVETPFEKWRFFAPEVIGGKPGTPAADQFALGSLLFYLLEGRLAYQGNSPDEVFRSMQQGVPKVTRAPVYLADTIRALLTPEAATRPTAEQVATKLESGAPRALEPERRRLADRLAEAEHAAMADELGMVVRERSSKARPIVASPAASAALVEQSVSLRASAPPRADEGRRRFIPIAAGVGLLLVVAGVIWWRQPVRPPPSPPKRPVVAAPAPKPQEAAPPPPPAAVAPKLETVAVAPDAGNPPPPNHLRIETFPTGATVWVDDAERGQTPADIELAPGEHRLMLILEGHQILRQAVDASKGVTLVKRLQAAAGRGGLGAINVDCPVKGKFPVFIDDAETGRLCPARNVPVGPGKHYIGILVPAERKIVGVEETVQLGAATKTVRLGF